jgi:lincosamide nucleotidyltransferase A/C/D/E
MEASLHDARGRTHLPPSALTRDHAAVAWFRGTDWISASEIKAVPRDRLEPSPVLFDESTQLPRRECPAEMRVGFPSCSPRSDILPDMEPRDVLDLLDQLDDRGIHYWLDGGWGVDCLLGEESRPHGDLDLVVPRSDLDRVRSLLVSRGFNVIRDLLPNAIAFRDDQGREVDLHPVDVTEDGGVSQVLLDGVSTWHYAPPVEGSLVGRAVRCSSAEDQLLMHQGYDARPVDVQDVRRLAEQFGLPLPEPFSVVEGEAAETGRTAQRRVPTARNARFAPHKALRCSRTPCPGCSTGICRPTDASTDP